MKKTVFKKSLAWVLTLMMVITFMPPVMSFADAGDVPEHSKTSTANGDGTYKLELTVTGDSDTEVKTAANVNVLVVYDVSNSMNSNASESRYTRADQAEDVVHDFIANLRSYQSSTDPSNIEMALITFAVTAQPRQTGNQNWTSNLTDNNGINRFFDNGGTDGQTNLGYTGNASYGTNWDAALSQASTVLNDADDDPTFVVFVTDGAPTARGNGGNAISPNSSLNQLRPYYEAALDDARSIQNADNITMFGIYAYGTEADLLDDLMYYSNTGTERTIRTDTDPADNYFNAADTAQLNAAIESIFQTIVEALGISAVAISDGTTHNVGTSTEPIELLEVDENSYQYWLSIPVDTNRQFQRIDLVSGETITYTVSEDGKSVTWGTDNSVEVNGKLSGGQFKYEWKGANALYDYAPPAAKLNGSAVDWNLSDVGTLLDGVTYSVTFDVYPSQTTLDIIADIKNDPGADGAWANLGSEVQKYIDVNGNLTTNTTAKLTYVDTRTGEGGEATFTNPDPVQSQAVEQLAVSKKWENKLDEEAAKPITLTVLRDGEPHYDVSLEESEEDDTIWKGSTYISIGIMHENSEGQMVAMPGSEGHDFTFEEPDDVSYHWELDIPTVHPMMIEGEAKMLVKVDEKHPVPEGKETFTIKDYLGVDSQYYLDETIQSLTATNHRRSSLNLTKVVEGSGAPSNATFPFTVKVVNSFAPETAPAEADDPNHESDWWVWFTVQDKNGNPVTTGVSGANLENGQYYAPSGEDVTIQAKAGYTISFINLPTQSTYTITEGTLPTDFTFKDAKIKVTQGEGTAEEFKGDVTSTGKIESTNTEYTVTYTNKYSKSGGYIPDEPIPLDLNGEDHFAYIEGYPDGTVQPEGNITRAEVATMIYRLLTEERRAEIFTSECNYSDVDLQNWFNKAVASMTAGEYVTGYPNGTFLPNQAITRAEFVTIVVRFLEGLRDAENPFSDIDDHWAKDYILSAVNAGWIDGYPDGTFRPQEPIKRNEAMKIMNTILHRGVNEESELGEPVMFPDNADPSAWYYYEVIEATNNHETEGERPDEDWDSNECEYAYDIEKYERPDPVEPEPQDDPEDQTTPENPDDQTAPEDETTPDSQDEPAATDSIVGQWEYTEEGVDGAFVYTFNEDGTGSYDMAGTVKAFTYTIEGNTLSILYEGDTEPFELPFVLTDTTLTVKDSNDEDVVYNKK